MKTCTNCHEEKEDAEFSKRKSRCKPCIKKTDSIYYATHRTERIEYSKNWKKKNHEKWKKYKNQWKKDNRKKAQTDTL